MLLSQLSFFSLGCNQHCVSTDLRQPRVQAVKRAGLAVPHSLLDLGVNREVRMGRPLWVQVPRLACYVCRMTSLQAVEPQCPQFFPRLRERQPCCGCCPSLSIFLQIPQTHLVFNACKEAALDQNLAIYCGGGVGVGKRGWALNFYLRLVGLASWPIFTSPKEAQLRTSPGLPVDPGPTCSLEPSLRPGCCY